MTKVPFSTLNRDPGFDQPLDPFLPRPRAGRIKPLWPSPNVAFVSRRRLIGLKRPPKGYFQGSPDLAVEVLSPSTTFEEIHTKLVEYFDNGTQLAWVINPAERSVLIYCSPQPAHLHTFNDTLVGEEILPGFELAVAELLPELEFWVFSDVSSRGSPIRLCTVYIYVSRSTALSCQLRSR